MIRRDVLKLAAFLPFGLSGRPTLQIGDRVRIIDHPDKSLIGREGVIEEIWHTSIRWTDGGVTIKKDPMYNIVNYENGRSFMLYTTPDLLELV